MSAQFKRIGPGIVIAATGLGAGDIVAASQAGAQYGTALLWAVVIGGVLKFVLNEGLARWQLVTGSTLLEGWIDRFPAFVSWYFAAYLLLWSFMVGAALMAACGLAAYAIFPQLSVAQWGAIHSLLALVLVLKGGYGLLEPVMKVIVGLMFASILYCAIRLMPSLSEMTAGFLPPRIPDNSLAYVLGIIGGVGGSVTVMSYGYWIKESGGKGEAMLSTMRLDLGVAYALTTIFGLALILITAGVNPEMAAGNNMALAVAARIEEVLGETGKWVFLVGFWGAVLSSMLGVWHGVPYLFANFFYHKKGQSSQLESDQSIGRTKAYRGFLFFIALLPMSLLVLDRPVWVVVIYAVTGAFFMPFLAALLLLMNGKRDWLGAQANRWWSKGLLGFCLLLFGTLLLGKVFDQF